MPTTIISSELSSNDPKLYPSPIVQDIIMTSDGIEDGVKITTLDNQQQLLIDYPSIITYILMFQKLSLTPIKDDDLLCLDIRYLTTPQILSTN
ncbi:MAG: hypothetical protein H7230_04580 [Candidatus Parcubacteria bacterium]|nr:hypothetical protein [Candidatus Paceibacterota bacterium]